LYCVVSKHAFNFLSNEIGPGIKFQVLYVLGINENAVCQKTYELHEDGQEMRPKHVRAIINK
jgi:hypothetical protein